MDFGRALPQAFRTLIAITTDPSISRPPHFVPAFTWPFTRLTPSRGRPSLLWSGAQPNKNNDCCDVSCVVFMDTMHLHATCAAQPEELLAAQSAIKKRRGASGCLRGRTKTVPSIPPSPTNPHTRRRTVPPTLHPIFRIARINRREGQWSLSANKFTVARRTSDIHALDKLHEGSERGGSRDVCAVNVEAENVPSGQFTTFCCTHERPINSESRAAFLAAIVCVAPSTRRQHARMLRPMLQMDRTPLDMMILGLQKLAAQ
ncbi:hypothetical protein TCDM_13406 [Trypanosoma cruzi Dm28c]|uniref:Uncharacterized protein n=1 Tax=Trypanosoma cruzi Dm28c TaxID=1416333 RepID=V5A2Y3_TRYCR|nr:hypothetical protein TCDM_13406 [Trypanosoma cruzi Dm28c]